MATCLVVALGGCRRPTLTTDTGATDTGLSDAGTTDAGMCTITSLPFIDATCAPLALATCCQEVSNCESTPECSDYYACVTGCADAPCVEACAATYPAGLSLAADLTICLRTLPGCPGSEICDSGFGFGALGCDTCLGFACCPESTACFGNSDCLDCINGDDLACMAGTLDEDLYNCWNQSCVASCGESGYCAPFSNLVFADSGCEGCAQSCCAVAEACDASPDCVSLWACAEPCADSSCVDACRTSFPAGEAAFAPFAACMGNCGTTCLPQGLVCGSSLSTGDATCDGCLEASCCPAFLPCINESDCLACISGNPPQCATSILDEPLRDCWTNNCTPDCGTPGF